MSGTVESDRERQMREAEELLGNAKSRSFAKGLFFGRYEADLALPWPNPSPEEQAGTEAFLTRVRAFIASEVDSYQIDKDAHVPERVIQGLFDLGVMSMSIPEEYGGLGFSQHAYCRVMEEFGAEDASLAVLINAHQSIGLKSLLLFGNDAQRARWLPRLVRGEMLAAFALTEPNAGSDAGGLETRAVLNEAGTHYVLNGRKQWITNGGVAGLLTVMAKTQGATDDRGRDQITAFLVTPDTPGFVVEDVALEKCGIRGTATARLRFDDMAVPVENIIGPPGKGLRVALTLLDFGRTTFGATCTGAAKKCVRDAVRHANERRQFGKRLGEFQLVKRKLARMAALAFAMESATYLTAAMIDRDQDDYMVETAMLKVYASEALWEIVNETIQIFGGRGYFTDQPYERMMRDHRIDLIGEGANDVLRTFIALVGMRDVGYALKDVLDALKSPLYGLGKLTGFAKRHLPGQDRVHVPARSAAVRPLADQLETLVREFGHAVEGQLMRHREAVLEQQYTQARLADAATEIYMLSAVVARLDAEAQAGSAEFEANLRTGSYFAQIAARAVRSMLAELGDNLDADTTMLADALLSDSARVDRHTNRISQVGE